MMLSCSSAAGEACWDTDDHCCSGLTCLGGFGDQQAKDEGHYGVCGQEGMGGQEDPARLVGILKELSTEQMIADHKV